MRVASKLGRLIFLQEVLSLGKQSSSSSMAFFIRKSVREGLHNSGSFLIRALCHKSYLYLSFVTSHAHSMYLEGQRQLCHTLDPNTSEHSQM